MFLPHEEHHNGHQMGGDQECSHHTDPCTYQNQIKLMLFSVLLNSIIPSLASSFLTISMANTGGRSERNCDYDTRQPHHEIHLRNVHLPLIFFRSVNHSHPGEATKGQCLGEDGECTREHCLACNDSRKNGNDEGWPEQWS